MQWPPHYPRLLGRPSSQESPAPKQLPSLEVEGPGIVSRLHADLPHPPHQLPPPPRPQPWARPPPGLPCPHQARLFGSLLQSPPSHHMAAGWQRLCSPKALASVSPPGLCTCVPSAQKPPQPSARVLGYHLLSLWVSAEMFLLTGTPLTPDPAGEGGGPPSGVSMPSPLLAPQSYGPGPGCSWPLECPVCPAHGNFS